MKKSAFRFVPGFSLLAVTFCVLVSSCSNFMDGSNLKNELDRKVKIANSICPQAKVEEPVFQDAGVARNKKIIISFTKSMNTQTFWENLSITDSLGNNLKPNFLEPIWSNENKTVEIPANELNLIDLRGKKYLDIYLTLTKSCEDTDALPIEKAIEHKYRINDEIDNVPPVLAYVRGELPPEYISGSADDLTKELYCGEYIYLTESDICKYNHINNKVNFYVEGSDYGGGEVSAHFVIQRLYDTGGKALNEEPLSKTKKLEQINYDGNYFGTIQVDMSDPQFYLDGMYKITVTVNDGSSDSETSKVYYVIRDTSLANSPGAMVWFMTPGFRQDETMEGAPEDDLYKYCLDPFDMIEATKDKIEYFRNRFIFGFILDDVYYISPFGTNKKYLQNHDDFKYLFSWGTNLSKLSEPVEVKGTAEVDYHYAESNIENMAGTKTPLYYFLPDSYIDYCDSHTTSDIYLQIAVVDSVGNSNNILTVIPKQIDFYNYEKVSVDNTTKDMTIRLNYSDLCQETSTDITGLLPVPDKSSEIKYRIFYAKIPEDYPESKYNELPLQRNLMYSYKQEVDNNHRANYKDNAELVIKNTGSLENPKYPKYLVYIQPDYGLHSTISDIWAGESFGPLYEVIVDVSTLQESDLDEPVINWNDPERAGDGTGLYQIKGTITNYDSYDSKTKFIPYVQTDDTNWVCYDTISSKNFSFIIMNPLKAPFVEWAKIDGIQDIWKDDYFEAYTKLGAAANYSTPIKVKIRAVSGNRTNDSDEHEISFTAEDNDNIAPTQIPKIVSHDSLLSFDGHSFKYGGSEGLIKEDEGHLAQTFTYYYTPYNEAWGNNLSILSEEEILSLPKGTGTYEFDIWVDTYNTPHEAKYKIKPIVPIYGFADGKYMFFAKVSDTKGNSNIITLGKADINSFENKLAVNYKADTQSYNASLVYNKNDLDRNMLYIQKFDVDSSNWVNQNEPDTHKELVDCTKNKQTKTLNYNIEKNKLTNKTFYRFTLQGFNEHHYDVSTQTGVRLTYKMPYNPPDPDPNAENYWDGTYDKMTNYDYLPNETEYDMYTDETISNTVYYYITDQNLSDIKNSFFRNTAAIRSNYPVLVNIISSTNNYGENIDEWERRGKIIKSEVYAPATQANFNDSVAVNAMYASNENGYQYYVIIVHFANNTSAISNVYTMEGM